MQRLQLSLPSLGERSLLLSELDGHTELLADPADPGAVEGLLGRLLHEPTGRPVELTGLLATWRDRALAALFALEFGNRIDSRGRCGACNASFEFAFALDDVLSAQDEAAAATGLTLDASGWWALADGARLRPPTLGAISEHEGPAALIASLCDGTIERDEAESLLDAAAPLLSVDLETSCPHCGERQQLAFEMGRYLVESLAAERPLLIRETHLIASRYGWGHETIMSLPRADRRAYAHLIMSERSTAAPRQTR